MNIPPAFRGRHPELLILDVDGVLTPNLIYLDGNGNEWKPFYVPDGAGLSMLRQVGVRVAFLSGRPSQATHARAEALKIAQRSKSERRTVIVTSDGKPDVCSTGDLATPQQISALIAQSVAMNPGLKIKVHTICVGASNNGGAINFMRRLATAHGGTFRSIGH